MKIEIEIDIEFEVISDKKNWGDIPVSEIRQALLKRVKQLDKDEEWKEATSSFDCYKMEET